MNPKAQCKEVCNLSWILLPVNGPTRPVQPPPIHSQTSRVVPSKSIISKTSHFGSENGHPGTVEGERTDKKKTQDKRKDIKTKKVTTKKDITPVTYLLT